MCNHPNPNLCNALGKHVYGHMWNIWQSSVLTEEKCNQYRIIWCQQAGITLSDALSIAPVEFIQQQKPGVLQLGANFAKAVKEYTQAGMKNVSEEIYKQRLETCEGCPFKKGNRCQHKSCGCNLAVKAKWASEKCPMDKWPKENEQ
jgi:hypothetical protein